jgi:hypothetical protein
LGTHAYPVDAQLSQCLSVLVGDVVWVTLDGYFLGTAAIYLIYIYKELAQLPDCQLAGRPATEVDGVYASPDIEWKGT